MSDINRQPRKTVTILPESRPWARVANALSQQLIKCFSAIFINLSLFAWSAAV